MTGMRVTGTTAALKVQLTDDEAAELAVLAQKGNAKARDTLAHSLMGLALFIAGAYHNKNRWMDEGEIQGEALEAMLRYGIDRYSLDSGIPVRTWVALVIRRRLASTVEKAHREEEGRGLVAATYEAGAAVEPPHNPNPAEDLHRLLTWAQRDGVLTPVQVSVLALRGEGLLFDYIGQHLGIHRKKASREYAAALVALEGHL